MSLNAKRLRKSSRHVCACGHRAVFVRPGWRDVAAADDHPLCFECFRALKNRARAAKMMRLSPDALAA